MSDVEKNSGTHKPEFAGERIPFDRAFAEVSRGVKKYGQNEYLEQGEHPIIDQGKKAIAGYSNEQLGMFKDVPAIVFGDHTRVFKYVDRPFFIGADGVKILKPLLSDNVLFWYYALCAANIENLGYSRHFKLLKEKSFLSPSHEDQASITQILETVDEQISLSNSLLSTLDDLVKSQFVEMFGDPVSNARGWSVATLGSTCEIVTGNTPSRSDPANYGDYLEWCKTDNITSGKYLTPAVELLSKAGAAKARSVPSGSILMACIAGSINSIGKVAIADRKVSFNQQINAIVPGERLNRDYLYWMLRLSKDYLCTGVNMQLKGILNKSTLSGKEFPLPPLALQQQFADFVARADKLGFSRLIPINNQFLR